MLRLVAFLHASEQYQLALPLVGLAVQWQWRLKHGEERQGLSTVAVGGGRGTGAGDGGVVRSVK